MPNRKRDTDVQNRLLDSVGEGGEGRMFIENSIETCILRVPLLSGSGPAPPVPPSPGNKSHLPFEKKKKKHVYYLG